MFISEIANLSETGNRLSSEMGKIFNINDLDGT